MSLSSYLAQKYLSASTPPHHDSDRPKKRRKKDKHASEQNTLIIADDDDLQVKGAKGRLGGEEDGDTPMMYAGEVKSAEFRRKKKSGWKDVTGGAGEGDGDSEGGAGAGKEEADEILREAVERDEERRREVEMEDAPTIVGEGEGVKMESGVKAGLQTVEDTNRLMEKEEKERRAEEKRRRKERKEEVEVQTIYRDASGRRIDVDAKRVEARMKEKEEEERKKREKEAAMGDVQRREKVQKKEDLDEARFMTLARGEDDEVMNEQLKEVVRWDDPMAAYMAKKRQEEAPKGRGGSDDGEVVVRKQKKVYQGHAAPNRYGIQPGWRWDGVDRGNGFEKEWFQARSKKARNEGLSYQWQEDE